MTETAIRGGGRGIVFADPRWPLLGRAYFGAQAALGAAWWFAVFGNEAVREATLGAANPVLVAAADVPLFVVASALAALGLRWACWIVVPWTSLVAMVLVVLATLTGRAGWGALAMVVASVGGAAAWLLIAQRRIPAERVLIGPLGFRVAGPATQAGHVRRTFAQLVVFWSIFLLLIPLVVAWFEMRWGLRVVPADGSGGAGAVWAGGGLLILASALGIWAAVAMSTRGDGTPLPSATARRLVVAGPYLHVRNPMALAGIVQAAGVGMMLGSWMAVAYALCGVPYWNWLVRPFEEADLEARFGDAYRAYRDRVRCWLPRISRRAW